MYIPKLFELNDPARLDAFMRANGFACMVNVVDGELMATHLPVELEDRAGQRYLFGHVARANKHWQAWDGETEALMIFTGPHSYITPRWYEPDDVRGPSVPTWNYTAVHAYGRPRIVPDSPQLRDMLRALVRHYEGDGAQTYHMDDAAPDYLDKMIKGIVAFEMPLDRVEGKFKLSQNRSEADRVNVAEKLSKMDDDQSRGVADLMHDFSLKQSSAS